MTGAPEPLLRVRGMTVAARSGRPIVSGVDLDAHPGEAVALAGPSGCGKSTLLRAVLDALPPGLRRTAGTVTWAGEPVRPGGAARRWRRAHAGVLDQDPASAVNPLLTARAAVLEGRTRALGGRRAARGRALELLDALGLDAADVAGRRPHTLSGGQVQRVALARAILADPPLLVLDEPTSGLDAGALDLVAAEVRRRGAGGGATLLVSHDPDFVARVADRVVAVGARPPAPPRATRPAPGRGGPPVLNASGLRLSHPGRPVLEDVSLEVRAGELVAVTGPSGSGKSTLLRALAGLHPPDGGSVALRGRPLAATAEARERGQLRGVQFVAQDPAGALNPAHPVGAAVVRPLRVLRGVSAQRAREEARELLSRVGLDPALAGRRPRELSGGQRQRVAVARALAAGPDVLLADEITSALDADTADAVLALLEELCGNGLAVLLATHAPGAVARAHRVLRVREHGLPDAVPPHRTEHSHVG